MEQLEWSDCDSFAYALVLWPECGSEEGQLYRIHNGLVPFNSPCWPLAGVSLALIRLHVHCLFKQLFDKPPLPFLLHSAILRGVAYPRSSI